MFEKVWDCELIVEIILELEAKGKPLYSSYIHHNYQTLHRAAFRYFGSWGDAITAAGLDYEKIRRTRRWTREKIIAGIRKAYEDGDDLSWRVVSKGKHSALGCAAICERHFGSWPAALAAAGVKEKEFRRYDRWSDAKVQRKMLAYYKKGVDMNAKAMEELDHKFFHAAVRRFGSWRNAVESCGLDYRHIAMRMHLDADDVLTALGDLQKQGVHMSSSNVQDTYPSIHAAAVRRFGTWTEARKQLTGKLGDFRFKHQRPKTAQSFLLDKKRKRRSRKSVSKG